MLSIADRTPLEVIEAIGSAPSVGRDRWISMAELIDGYEHGDGYDLAPNLAGRSVADEGR